MIELDLYNMSIAELIELMIIWVNELVVLHKVHEHKRMDEIQKEVELIHRIISEKLANEKPLK